MLRKIIAYHLLLIFLLCTFQIGVTTHICCGKVVETKIFAGTGTASCGMEKDAKKDCNNNTSQNVEKQCCQDLISKFQFSEDFSTSIPKLKFSKDDFQLSSNFVQTLPFINLPFVNMKVDIKPPPELATLKESLPLLQVFRI